MNAKERPILFSGTMVRALLAGTKTQTRRIVKPQPMPDVEFVREHEPEVYGHGAFCAFRQDGRVLMHQRMAPCPYGQPGDRLWVRETFVTGYEMDDNGYFKTDEAGEYIDKVWYRASTPELAWYDGGSDSPGDPKWKPSIFMPRWASRLTLEIVSVRVERLTSISEATAIAEGVECFHGRFWQGFEGGPVQSNPVRAYRDLWESINGPESWEANPWVWVVEFRRVES